jgi:hypothetical protein
MPWATALADGCPDNSQDIVTDRPSVTNSSVVVPTASLQMENGINWTEHPGQGTLDGPNTRLRLGLGGCTEMLVDLPDYTGGLSGHGPSGFSDVAPAIKHQFGGLPEGTNLSASVCRQGRRRSREMGSTLIFSFLGRRISETAGPPAACCRQPG